jgi:hypothetical protein
MTHIPMTGARAIGILAGIESGDAVLKLAAARYLRDHKELWGTLPWPGTRDATALANYSDINGDSATIESLGG